MGTFLENALLNASLRATTYTSPTTVYAGLHTADPTDTTATALGNEVTGNNYARIAITFGVPTSGSMSTTADIVFPAATGSWGTIGFISIWDALTTGNLYYHGILSPTVTINNTDQLKILTGNLTVQLT